MIAASLVVADQPLVAGPDGVMPIPGQYMVTMSFPGIADATQVSDTTTFEFPATAPGDYTFSAQRLNTLGVPMTALVTAVITVPVPVAPAVFSAPVSITLSLA